MNPSKNDAEPTGKSAETKSQVILEYFKILTWPVIVLFLILNFSSPISRILNEVPSILGNADSIEIGQLKITIDKVLAKKASPEVRRVLKELNNDDIEEILQLGNDTLLTTTFSGSDSTNVNVKRYLNWTRIGLVTRMSNDALKEYGNKHKDEQLPAYGFTTNQLLIDTRLFLVSFIPNVLNQQK